MLDLPVIGLLLFPVPALDGTLDCPSDAASSPNRTSPPSFFFFRREAAPGVFGSLSSAFLATSPDCTLAKVPCRGHVSRAHE